jgi:hypothetical protein
MRRQAYGMDEGKGFHIPDDFDAPLPPEIQRYFEGESDPEDHLEHLPHTLSRQLGYTQY